MNPKIINALSAMAILDKFSGVVAAAGIKPDEGFFWPKTGDDSTLSKCLPSPRTPRTYKYS